MNRALANYFDAAQYATSVLGAAAVGFYPHLRKLARYDSIETLRQTIDSWRPQPKPSEPTPEQPSLERWTPCKKFGGCRSCPRCVLEETKAGIIYAGVMAKAEAMFRDAKDGGFREFVQYKIKAALFPWTKGADHHEFDDIEQVVWRAVAVGIAKYEDTGKPMAWLEKVVNNAVIDYARRTFAEKRGATVTGSLNFDPPSEPLPAQPTAKPAQISKLDNADRSKITFNSAGIPFVKS